MNEPPPHSVIIERAVLGAIILDPASGADRVGQLRASDFYTEECRAVFRALLDLHRNGQAADEILLANALGKESVANPQEIVSRLAEACPVASSFDSHLPELHNLAARRELIRLGQQAIESAQGDSADVENLSADFLRTTAEVGRRHTTPVSLGLFEVARDDSHASELIQHRYLTRGNAMEIAAGTGLGKSVFVLQTAICLATGRSFCGLVAPRPLKVLLVQAENDNHEIATMRDGICGGLALSESDQTAVNECVTIATYDGSLSWRDVVGRWIEPLVKNRAPDVLMIDPLLGFFTGKLVSEELTLFIRGYLRRLAIAYNLGIILSHHVPKPPGDKSRHRKGWSELDHAYAGIGGSDLANCVRAEIDLEQTADPTILRVWFGKRGHLLGARPTYLRKSDDSKAPFWVEVNPEDQPASLDPSESIVGKILAKIPPGEKLPKAIVRGWTSDFHCSRREIDHAVELALHARSLSQEDEKVGRTYRQLLARPLAKITP